MRSVLHLGARSPRTWPDQTRHVPGTGHGPAKHVTCLAPDTAPRDTSRAWHRTRPKWTSREEPGAPVVATPRAAAGARAVRRVARARPTRRGSRDRAHAAHREESPPPALPRGRRRRATAWSPRRSRPDPPPSSTRRSRRLTLGPQPALPPSTPHPPPAALGVA